MLKLAESVIHVIVLIVAAVMLASFLIGLREDMSHAD